MAHRFLYETFKTIDLYSETGQTKHFCLYCYLSRSYPSYGFHREIFQVKSAGHEQMLIVKYTPNHFGSLGCGNQDAEQIFVRIISISQNNC